MKFCLSYNHWQGDDVRYHLTMTMTHTKTNTKTRTKTNAKCFKDAMYVIFLKSLRFKDFRYDIGDDKDKDMMDMKSGGWVIDSFSPSRPIDQ